MLTIKTTFITPDQVDLLRKFGLQRGGAVQTALDLAVMRYCAPYVPMETSVLRQSVYIATVAGSGEVVWNTPYAHYLYYGIVYGPNFPIFEDNTGLPTGWRSRKGVKKHPTGRTLTYHGGDLQGSFWFERMKADHLNDLVQEVHDIVSNQQH